MRYEIAISVAAVFSIGLSAWLFDATGSAVAFGAAAAVISAWIPLAIRRRDSVTAVLTVDPDRPEAETIRGAFIAALDRANQTRLPVTLRMQTPSSRAYVRYELSLRRNGDPELSLAGHRPVGIKTEGRWIADHPVPLHFNGQKACELRFSPTDSNRVRVDLCRTPGIPAPLLFALLGLALTAGFFNLPELQCAASSSLLFLLLAPGQP